MPSSSRSSPTILTLLILAGWAAYWLTFLMQPLVEGNQGLTRGAFLLSCLVYPEGLVATWTDGGRLPAGWFDRFPLAVATLAWLGPAMIVGWPWCAAIVPRPLPPQQRRTWLLLSGSWSCLAGLAVLSSVTLLVGLFGGLSSPLPLILTLIILLVSGYAVRRGQLTRRSETTDAVAHSGAVPASQSQGMGPANGLLERSLQLLAVALTCWCGVVIMLGAWVPPSEFDVLEYHLQAPKEFYQNGAIEFVPHNIYANMPLGIEMHTLSAMTLLQQPDAWWGGLIGKSISAAFSLIGAGLLGGWLALRYGSRCGWWGAGLWLATPGIAHVATQGLIDGALATYCLASALAAWQLVDAQSQRREQVVAWSALLALLSGAAAAAKYPGLVFVTLPSVALLAWCLVNLYRESLTLAGPARANARWQACQVLVVSGLGLAITCGAWYAKNWWLTGNPVYPLAAQLLDGQTMTLEKITQWQGAHRVPPMAQLPGDLTRLLLSSSFVQPSMILGLSVAFVWLWRSPRQSQLQSPQLQSQCVAQSHLWLGLLAWSLWILIIWIVATHRIDRFWLPLTGLWSALAAWGLYRLSQRWVWLAYLLVLPGLVYGALLNSSPVVTDNRYFVTLAALRDDEGDEQHVPRVPLAQAWINRHFADQAVRMLLVGEARVFEYRVPVVYSSCFDTNPGEPMLAGHPPAEQLQALQAAGITHVMINWSEINRYRSPGNYGFSSWPTPDDIQQLVADGVLTPVAWSLHEDQAQLLEVKQQ